jgi:hypothetical protein
MRIRRIELGAGTTLTCTALVAWLVTVAGLPATAHARRYPLARKMEVACKSHIRIYRSGKIAGCIPYAIRPYPIATTTASCHRRPIRFYSNGLLRECVIAGRHKLPLRSGAKVPCTEDTVVFHYDGYLKSCMLVGTHTFKAGGGKVRCQGSRPVELHRNGSLRSCSLESSQSFSTAEGKRRRCKAGRRVFLDAAGQLVSC